MRLSLLLVAASACTLDFDAATPGTGAGGSGGALTTAGGSSPVGGAGATGGTSAGGAGECSALGGKCAPPSPGAEWTGPGILGGGTCPVGTQALVLGAADSGAVCSCTEAMPGACTATVVTAGSTTISCGGPTNVPAATCEDFPNTVVKAKVQSFGGAPGTCNPTAKLDYEISNTFCTDFETDEAQCPGSCVADAGTAEVCIGAPGNVTCPETYSHRVPMRVAECPPCASPSACDATNAFLQTFSDLSCTTVLQPVSGSCLPIPTGAQSWKMDSIGCVAATIAPDVTDYTLCCTRL